jgi:hypothetical protein
MGREVGKLKAQYETLKEIADNKTFSDGINAFIGLGLGSKKKEKKRRWRYN